MSKVFYQVGLVAGGLAAGVLWASLFSLLPPWDGPNSGLSTIIVVACLAVAAAARDMGFISYPLPERRRQVPQSILWAPRSSGSLQFGFELGTGMRTYLPGSAPVLALAMALVIDVPFLWVLAGYVGFGAGRGFVLIERRLATSGDMWDRKVRESRRAVLVASSLFVGIVGVTNVIAG